MEAAVGGSPKPEAARSRLAAICSAQATSRLRRNSVALRDPETQETKSGGQGMEGYQFTKRTHFPSQPEQNETTCTIHQRSHIPRSVPPRRLARIRPFQHRQSPGSALFRAPSDENGGPPSPLVFQVETEPRAPRLHVCANSRNRIL